MQLLRKIKEFFLGFFSKKPITVTAIITPTNATPVQTVKPKFVPPSLVIVPSIQEVTVLNQHGKHHVVIADQAGMVSKVKILGQPHKGVAWVRTFGDGSAPVRRCRFV